MKEVLEYLEGEREEALDFYKEAVEREERRMRAESGEPAYYDDVRYYEGFLNAMTAAIDPRGAQRDDSKRREKR